MSNVKSLHIVVTYRIINCAMHICGGQIRSPLKRILKHNLNKTLPSQATLRQLQQETEFPEMVFE